MKTLHEESKIERLGRVITVKITPFLSKIMDTIPDRLPAALKSYSRIITAIELQYVEERLIHL